MFCKTCILPVAGATIAVVGRVDRSRHLAERLSVSLFRIRPEAQTGLILQLLTCALLTYRSLRNSAYCLRPCRPSLRLSRRRSQPRKVPISSSQKWSPKRIFQLLLPSFVSSIPFTFTRGLLQPKPKSKSCLPSFTTWGQDDFTFYSCID